jgi:hypothetical protein
MDDSKANDKILAEYELDAHGTTVKIQIIESEEISFLITMYRFPGVGDATKLLVMSLRTELTSQWSQ